ncbi:HMG high mobility group box-containing protein [Nitzschia inconspicua]|uniref:HMG high mobility group box-containing protein n=1 Tax=Nitzschia inconspicua TaxID=303405 RepID=A0A9K3LLT1_9STRA|nr:HMG high mobility group box-containing protein [Nitzschia inconspicua]
MILMGSRDESSTTTNDPTVIDEDDVDDQNDTAQDVTEEECTDSMATVKQKKVQRKYKKAPGAPKRFRSAFILFSQFKHKEIQALLAEKGDSEKTTSVAKMVSEAWKTMNPKERAKWEDKAIMDRERFEKEKMRYRGPWTVPIGHRKSKDPTAPKRPASAFLSFSNGRRAAVKQANKHASNAEISKILSDMWKDAPNDIKQEYTEREAAAREEYKKKMAEWKLENEKTKKKKKDPLELYQENEQERKRRGIQSDEEDGYEYDSEEDEVRWKKRSKRRKEEPKGKNKVLPNLDSPAARGGTLVKGTGLDRVSLSLEGSENPAQARFVAPHMYAQAPLLSSYPGVNPALLAPSSLAIHLQDGRPLPTLMNGSMLQSSLPLSRLAGYPSNIGPNFAAGHFSAVNTSPGLGVARSLHPNYLYHAHSQLGSSGGQGQHQITNLTLDQKREQEFVLQLLAARRQQREQPQRRNERKPPAK